MRWRDRLAAAVCLLGLAGYARGGTTCHGSVGICCDQRQATDRYVGPAGVIWNQDGYGSLGFGAYVPISRKMPSAFRVRVINTKRYPYTVEAFGNKRLAVPQELIDSRTLDCSRKDHLTYVSLQGDLPVSIGINMTCLSQGRHSFPNVWHRIPLNSLSFAEPWIHTEVSNRIAKHKAGGWIREPLRPLFTKCVHSDISTTIESNPWKRVPFARLQLIAHYAPLPISGFNASIKCSLGVSLVGHPGSNGLISGVVHLTGEPVHVSDGLPYLVSSNSSTPLHFSKRLLHRFQLAARVDCVERCGNSDGYSGRKHDPVVESDFLKSFMKALPFGWLNLIVGIVLMAAGIFTAVFGSYLGGQEFGIWGFACAFTFGLAVIVLSCFLISHGIRSVDPVLSASALAHSNLPYAESSDAGRWPANVLLDEESAAVLDEQSESQMHGAGHARAGMFGGDYNASSYNMSGSREMGRFGDSGGASRFFYCAKASRSERGEGNTHPTVKPLKLCEYLARLILPPTNGNLLVPFCGSGSEMIGALQVGWEDVTGIDNNDEYVAIAERRIANNLAIGMEVPYV